VQLPNSSASDTPERAHDHTATELPSSRLPSAQQDVIDDEDQTTEVALSSCTLS
jgi:hypothetical protein